MIKRKAYNNATKEIYNRNCYFCGKNLRNFINGYKFEIIVIDKTGFRSCIACAIKINRDQKLEEILNQ